MDAEGGKSKPMEFENFCKAYEFVLQCIDREDNLVNFRLNWALILNVALFAFLYNVNGLSFDPIVKSSSVGMICLSGIFFTIVSFLAIWAANNQIEYLKYYLEGISKEVDERFIPRIKMRIPIHEFSLKRRVLSRYYRKNKRWKQKNVLLKSLIFPFKKSFYLVSEKKGNIIENKTGFLRPYGRYGILRKDAGAWGAPLLCFFMSFVWLALLLTYRPDAKSPSFPELISAAFGGSSFQRYEMADKKDKAKLAAGLLSLRGRKDSPR